MGHLSNAVLARMHGGVIGADNVLSLLMSHPSACECLPCSLAKASRKNFTSSSSGPPLTSILEMFVADLCGPIFRQYISLIIDAHCGYIFIAILNKKSEAATQIMDSVRQAQTQTNRTLKHFHSDGGGEYHSNALLKFFKEQGTLVTTTTRNTPQHNGKAEVYNRMVLQTARAMLFHARLPVSFWKYAVLTAVYLLNRSVPSSHKKEHKTRIELFTGHKPSLSHLRVFGCNVQRQVLHELRASNVPHIISWYLPRVRF